MVMDIYRGYSSNCYYDYLEITVGTELVRSWQQRIVTSDLIVFSFVKTLRETDFCQVSYRQFTKSTA